MTDQEESDDALRWAMQRHGVDPASRDYIGSLVKQLAHVAGEPTTLGVCGLNAAMNQLADIYDSWQEKLQGIEL